MFHVEHSGEGGRWLRDGAAELGVSLSKDQVALFLLYLAELKSWNEKVNLTGLREDKEIIAKHFLDSLACGKAIGRPQGASLLDVGSGAGFPGLPLKIVHPELNLTLLEPSQKKTAFLRHVIGTLHLEGVRAISERIEQVTSLQHLLGTFSYIVTRALDPLEVLSFVTSMLATQGRLILCRAKPLDRNIELDGLEVSEEIPYSLPFGYGERVLTVLTMR